MAFRSHPGPRGEPVPGPFAVVVHVVGVQQQHGRITRKRQAQRPSEDPAIVQFAVRLDPAGVVGVAQPVKLGRAGEPVDEVARVPPPVGDQQELAEGWRQRAAQPGLGRRDLLGAGRGEAEPGVPDHILVQRPVPLRIVCGDPLLAPAFQERPPFLAIHRSPFVIGISAPTAADRYDVTGQIGTVGCCVSAGPAVNDG